MNLKRVLLCVTLSVCTFCRGQVLVDLLTNKHIFVDEEQDHVYLKEIDHGHLPVAIFYHQVVAYPDSNMQQKVNLLLKEISTQPITRPAYQQFLKEYYMASMEVYFQELLAMDDEDDINEFKQAKANGLHMALDGIHTTILNYSNDVLTVCVNYTYTGQIGNVNTYNTDEIIYRDIHYVNLKNGTDMPAACLFNNKTHVQQLLRKRYVKLMHENDRLNKDIRHGSRPLHSLNMALDGFWYFSYNRLTFATQEYSPITQRGDGMTYQVTFPIDELSPFINADGPYGFIKNIQQGEAPKGGYTKPVNEYVTGLFQFPTADTPRSEMPVTVKKVLIDKVSGGKAVRHSRGTYNKDGRLTEAYFYSWPQNPNRGYSNFPIALTFSYNQSGRLTQKGATQFNVVKTKHGTDTVPLFNYTTTLYRYNRNGNLLGYSTDSEYGLVLYLDSFVLESAFSEDFYYEEFEATKITGNAGEQQRIYSTNAGDSPDYGVAEVKLDTPGITNSLLTPSPSMRGLYAFKYDSLGRVTTARGVNQYPDFSIVYDEHGNVTDVTRSWPGNTHKHHTHFEYNDANLPTRSTVTTRNGTTEYLYTYILR